MSNLPASGRHRWKTFWANQTTPLHAAEDEDGLRELAGELRLLFTEPTRVLEIGCGNGALFTHLGFDRATRYLGVDFSPTMLAEFRDRLPGTDLVTEDGATFRTSERFDLVFLGYVVQYWDRGQLSRHLANARAMVTHRGRVVLAGFPWSRMRLAYARGDVLGGDLTGHHRRSLPMTVVELARELLTPRVGHWYDFSDVHRLADRHGFTASFRCSNQYPYRFHAVLHPR